MVIKEHLVIEFDAFDARLGHAGNLADRGFVSPWQAMWTPNIVLTIVGVIGLVRVSRESGSTRGGDFQEVLDGIRHLFRRLRGVPAPAEDAR